MADDMVPLLTPETKIKVSSTLDKSVGKKYLTDGSCETCWTSQQGIPQYIQASFDSPSIPKQISLTFQGGFVGMRCSIEVQLAGIEDKSEWLPWTKVYPENVNRRQTFDLVPMEEMGSGVKSIKLVFEESSDFFGRIIVYDLQILGRIV